MTLTAFGFEDLMQKMNEDLFAQCQEAVMKMYRERENEVLLACMENEHLGAEFFWGVFTVSSMIGNGFMVMHDPDLIIERRDGPLLETRYDGGRHD